MATAVERFPQFVGLVPSFADQLAALHDEVSTAGGAITFPPGGGLRSTERQKQLRKINGCRTGSTCPTVALSR